MDALLSHSDAADRPLQLARHSLIRGGVTTILADNVTWMPFGPIQSWTYGNGLLASRSYDLDYRPTNISDTKISRDYGYSHAGDITSLTFSVAEPGVPILSNLTYGYQSGTNRLTSVTPAGQVAVPLGYDSRGNITAYGNLSLGYDSLGRLTSTSLGGLPAGSYLYNFRNQRARKVVGGAKTVYLFDLSGNLIAEGDGAGSVTKEFVYFGPALASLPLAEVDGGGVYYYHTDHQGTPIRMTNGSQTTVWEAGYSVSGASRVSEDPDGDGVRVRSNLRFPGQYYDGETGLVYNWHRYYAPELGRYLQPDPLGLAGGPNLYAYVSNDPLGWIDPTGLINLRIPGTSGETTMHANPGPAVVPPGSGIPVEHGPGHIHLGSNSGPRIRTDNFEPFSDKDAQRLTRKQRNFCKGLSAEDKALIRARQEEVFTKGIFTGAVSMFAHTVTQHCTNDPLDCYEVFNEPED